MPSTYMALTNRVLRRLNEVEITQSDFAAAKGIQAAAKDCVLDTIREINTTRVDWPFNATSTTQVLTVGTEEYSWPSDFSAADWNSFQIQRDVALSVNHKILKPISREEWYEYLRDSDMDSTTDGKNIPIFCFPSHGQGFGVSPSPDQAYTVGYKYYSNPDDLSDYDDETTIPNKFDYVIIAGALYQMNLFKENPEGAGIMQQKYKAGLDAMTNLFLPNVRNVTSGMCNFGGGHYKSNYIWNES